MTEQKNADTQIEHAASTAEEFWQILSPERHLFDPEEKLLFRGQADAQWGLTPSILRDKNHPIHAMPLARGQYNVSEMQFFTEIIFLSDFANYCDSSGLRLPSDSADFRNNFLVPNRVMDTFISQRKLWPSDEYYDLMAIAQHHGLPTRLLDWTRRAYVAAYFAASEALKRNLEGRFAVWALNTKKQWLMKSLEIVKVPGGNNVNVAAQAGVFTLLRQAYQRGEPFSGPSCLAEYVASTGENALLKLTLASTEAPKVLDLCARYGVTGATLFPDFYGAVRATLDGSARWSRSHFGGGQDIQIKTTPAFVDKQKL